MKYTAALLIFSTLSASTPAPIPAPVPQDKPSGHEVEITAVTYGGTGCPDKTVQGLLSDDKTTITLSFDQYTVQVLSASTSHLGQLAHLLISIIVWTQYPCHRTPEILSIAGEAQVPQWLPVQVSRRCLRFYRNNNNE